MLVVASRRLVSTVLCALRFLFLDLACFMVEKVLSHTYALPNMAYTFSAKSFSLGILSLLTNFQKLSTAQPNAV